MYIVLDIYKFTLDFLTELWNSFEQISNKSIVRHLKDWSLSILVDCHNDFAVLHSSQVLDSSGDSHGNVKLWGNNFTSLTNLHIVGDHTSINSSSAGPHSCSQLVSEVVQHGEVVPGLHATASAHHHLGRGQVGSVALAQFPANKL